MSTRVLVVDDCAADRTRLRRELARVARESGVDVQVSEAASGAEALAQIAADPPDLVLTDLSMPGFANGYIVQRAAQARGVRVEIMSGLPPLAPAYASARSKDTLEWVREVVVHAGDKPAAAPARPVGPLQRDLMRHGGVTIALVVALAALVSGWV